MWLQLLVELVDGLWVEPAVVLSLMEPVDVLSVTYFGLLVLELSVPKKA